MHHRLRITGLCLVLSATLSAGPQAPPPSVPSVPSGPSAPSAPGQTPTFRVNVEYVEVDAVVTDRNGRLVRGLTQDDFQIFEDGKPQPISAFSTVDIPVERAPRPLYSPQAIEPDVETIETIETNERPFDGRVYVMVVDDLHTYVGRSSRVRAAARQFIEQHLGANDLMAVVHTAGPTDASQEFTSSKRLLLAAVDRTIGRKVQSATVGRTEQALRDTSTGRRSPGDAVADPDEAERRFNARQSLNAVRGVADWFATVRGRRKAILFVSEGIDYDISDFDNPGGSLIMDAARETIAAAARGNVSIYGIDPRGLTNLADETIELGSLTGAGDISLGLGDRSIQRELLLSQSSLRQLSDDTGGFAVVNANDFATAFERIVRDSSSYYAMAYYPPDTKAGKFHKIEVKVRRPDLQVRARQGYVSPKAVAKKADDRADAASSGGKLTPELRAALNSPLPVSGLTMKVFAAPFKGTAAAASIVLGVELRGRDLRLDPRDKVAVSFTIVDAKGKVRAGSTDTIDLALKPDTRERVVAKGIRLLNRVALPPGRYQLRVAAHDAGGGGVGSVLYDLEVPDFAKLPFSISGMVLASPGATEPTVRPDEALRQMLPGPPMATRAFARNDEIALFVEVYDNQGSKPHKVDITATVTTDAGTVVAKQDEVRDSSELGGGRGGYGFATRFATTDLAPGVYVLAVSAASRLGGTAAVARRTAFTVTGK
jgi:VWFA-related protein